MTPSDSDSRDGEQRARDNGLRAIGRVFKAPEWGLVAGILAVLVVIYFLDPKGAFFGPYNLKTVLHLVSRFGVLALGATIVIIAGGIDLSTGSVVALASVVSAKLLTEWLRTGPTAGVPPSPAIVALAIGITLVMGLAIGLFHAAMINLFQLPPFIATLATMAGLRSVASVLSNKRTITVPYDAFRILGSNPWVTLAIFLGLALATSVMMGRTVLGRHIYALGGNEAAARLSGLRTRRLKAIVYGLSGVLSALGGIIFAGYTGQADYQLGVGYELIAITAAVVGGCSLSGGIGSIRGTVLGLILTQVVIKGTGQVVRQIESTQIEGLVLGVVVILAVAFNQRFRVRRE
jgi:ribose/xylose/arabinose/galactoside ABC-type transport system permease subunit